MRKSRKRGPNVILREYNKNKTAINEAFERAYPDVGVEYANKPKSAYQWFKRLSLAHEEEYEVRGYKQMRTVYDTKGLSRREQRRRARTVLESELVKSREQRSRENLRKAFAKDKEASHHLRSILGWKRKVDWQNIQYHKGMTSEDSYFYAISDDGTLVAFRFGEFYKNTRELQILNLDEVGNVERVVSPYEYM